MDVLEGAQVRARLRAVRSAEAAFINLAIVGLNIVRMRAFFPPGWSTTDWPRRNVLPPVNVPVTTVPIPCNLKTRSTGKRGLPMSGGRRHNREDARESGFQMV